MRTGHFAVLRSGKSFVRSKVWAQTEFAKKMINQGMIYGTMAFVYITFLLAIEKKGI